MKIFCAGELNGDHLNRTESFRAGKLRFLFSNSWNNEDILFWNGEDLLR